MAGRKRRSEPAGRAEALCGCDASAAGRGGKPAAVDPEVKAAAVTRLRRVEGQVRGLQRMVDQERYCPEILNQMASVQEALRAVARSLMRNHLKHCVATAHGSSDSERVYNELLELIFRQSR
jgi:CsoR family transcriptional regulator, copper-sensing transcriptional repressor